MVSLGPVDLGIGDLYTGIIWLTVGILCTVLPEHRGLTLAAVLPLLVGLLPEIFWVNPAQRAAGQSLIQFFRFGAGPDIWINFGLIPLGFSMGGAYLGEFFLTQYDE